MLILRKAELGDHKFLIQIDVKAEGNTSNLQHDEKENSNRMLDDIIKVSLVKQL